MSEAILITSTLSYLFGSIPFGLILLLMFRGVDVRKTGSGNIGAVNVGRVAPRLGVLTLLLDASKGFAAVTVTSLLLTQWPSIGGVSKYAALGASAMFAVVGHVFPVWLRFHGGKGVATAMGACLALTPKMVLVAVLVYLLVLVGFRYASLASVTAALVVPLVAYRLVESDARALLPFLCALCLLTIVKHHENIHRLFSGTEPRLF